MAMIYFLYTGEVTFAPFVSYPFHRLPSKERTRGWNAAGPLPPSAKSVYRLADKVINRIYSSVSTGLIGASMTYRPSESGPRLTFIKIWNAVI